MQTRKKRKSISYISRDTERALKKRKRPVISRVEIDGPPNSNPFFVTFYVRTYSIGRALDRVIRYCVFNEDFKKAPDMVLFPHGRNEPRDQAQYWTVSYRLTAISNSDSEIVIRNPIQTRERMYQALIGCEYLASFPLAEEMAGAA